MKLRRYEWTGTFSNFESNCYSYLQNDPFWKIRHAQNQGWDNWGTIEFENVKKPEMIFTLSAYSGNSFNGWRTGMGTDYNSGKSNYKPNLYTNHGGQGDDIPVTVTTSSVNPTYEWTVFTSEDYIFIFGNTTNYANTAVPIRMFMGLMKPYEEEDPAIADNFWGMMPMMPMNVNDSWWGNYASYNVGKGVVYRSRNNSVFPYYYFETSSVLPSPGTNGKYYISPFYVFEPNEGVRGEFGKVFTAVLDNPSSYPDGSIMKVEGRTYYVFHVPTQQFPDDTYYRHSDGTNYYVKPYFFDSNYTPSGQRILLFDITEKEPVATLSVDKTSVTVEKDQTVSIKVTETIVGESGTVIKDVTLKTKYTIANASIASMSAGTITGLDVGSTTLTLEVGEHDPIVIPITITAPPPTISLVVDKADVSILKYETDTITVTQNSTTYDGIVTPTDVTSLATYTVSDDTIVSVSNGTITALSVGTATVTATYDGLSTTTTVEVLPPLPVYTLSTDKTEVSMKENETNSFIVTKHTDNDGIITNEDVTLLATYTVANPLTASVDKGVVTGIEDGSTTITVEHEGMTATVNVIVLPADAVITMSVDKTNVTIEAGLTDALTVTKHTDYDDVITDEDITATATYVSADETVATVTGGVITAVAEGTTTITVSYNGLSELVTVTVTAPAPVIIKTMSANKTAVSIEEGATDSVIITKHTDTDGVVVDEDVTALAVYTSSNDLIATAANGVITAHSEGTATITATHEGMTVDITVTVTAPVVIPPAEPVVTLSVDKTDISLVNGTTDTVVVTKTTDDNGTITNEDVTALATYSSSDELVATASAGTITATGIGTAVITISHETMTATINVTVTEGVTP